MALNLKPFQSEIEDIKPGDTIRLNHGTHCGAGEDTRRRLYLTRTLADPLVVVGYCHNCCEGGKVSDKAFQNYRTTRHGSVLNTHLRAQAEEGVWPLANLVTNLRDWPVYAQAWAMKNKLTQADLEGYGIAFDPTSDRVYLPEYKHVLNNRVDPWNFNGYQLRAVNNRNEPKYITARKEESKGFCLLYRGSFSKTLVIVEDLVSGIHIMNSGTDVDVIVNYGVKINPFVLSNTESYDKVIMWFDNDSQYIINQAKQYARTLALYNSLLEVSVVDDLKDPKHYVGASIKQKLEQMPWIQ